MKIDDIADQSATFISRVLAELIPSEVYHVRVVTDGFEILQFERLPHYVQITVSNADLASPTFKEWLKAKLDAVQTCSVDNAGDEECRDV